MLIQHEAHKALSPIWQKVRDVVSGEEVVKGRRTEYLPMLTSQAEVGDHYAMQDYESYLTRACFYGAASRTVMGLVGAVLRKEPSIEGVPEQHLRDITDRLGVNYEGADSMVLEQLRDAVSVGRYALLVDRGDDESENPYVAKYAAEDIVYWDKTIRGGRAVVSTIVLRQTYQERDEDAPEWKQPKERPEYLVLRLGPKPDVYPDVPGADQMDAAPTGEDFYWQEVWREEVEDKKGSSAAKAKLELVRLAVPTMSGGRYWDEIPCDIVNAVGGITCEVEMPPMAGLANVILAHYRGSADLEWGRHMTAIPQPWVAGADIEEGERLVVGCGYAWAIKDPAGKVAYLEFTGAGLGHIAEGQKDKEKQAAVLGARMLEDQPNTAEAMGTVRLRQSGDRSVLATIAHNVGEAMTRAIQRYLRWLSPVYDSMDDLDAVRYELSSDFEGATLDPAEMTALMQQLQAGVISYETFLFNMRRGERLPPGVTDEDERERIQIGAPGRSRDAELAQLQADVREGRISRDTYLQQIQALGMLPGVDLAAEAERIYEEKVMSAELQMQAFQQAGGNLGMPGAGPVGPEREGPEDEATEDDPEEPETVPTGDGDEDAAQS